MMCKIFRVVTEYYRFMVDKNTVLVNDNMTLKEDRAGVFADFVVIRGW